MYNYSSRYSRVIKTFIIACLTGVFSASVCATDLSDYWYPYDDPWSDPCRGYLAGIGELLVFRPTTCDREIALVAGEPHTFCSNYETGFRVGGGYVYHFGYRDLRAVFSHLTTHSHYTLPALEEGLLRPKLGNHEPVLFNGRDRLGIQANCHGRMRIEWNAIEGELAAHRLIGSCLALRAFLGLHWTDIHLSKELFYQGTSALEKTDVSTIAASEKGRNTVHQRSWGIGPRIGANFRYTLPCGFGVSLRGAGSVLSGEARGSQLQEITHYQETTQSPNAVETTCNESCLRRPNRIIVFPEWDLRIGANFLLCPQRALTLFFEVGYEVRSYLNALSRTIPQGREGALRQERCDAFSLHGLYLHLMIEF